MTRAQGGATPGALWSSSLLRVDRTPVAVGTDAARRPL